MVHNSGPSGNAEKLVATPTGKAKCIVCDQMLQGGHRRAKIYANNHFWVNCATMHASMQDYVS